jgi:hypothetical protein
MINKSKFLTIGMQTHNRIELAKKRIVSIYERGLPDWVEFIVLAEKESKDNTWLELESLNRKYPFTLYCGRGQGFSDAFMQVIIKSKGKYCMHLPDEDDFNLDSLFNLKRFLNKKNPDIVVSNYFIQDENKKLKPYRINSTRVINPVEFSSCSHNPGIIWHVEKAKKYVNTTWDQWRKDYEVIVKYYPHILLMIKILPNLSSWFYNEAVCFQKDSYENQHTQYMGGEYNNLIPRWVQFNELVDFITIEKKHEAHEAKLQYDRMLEAHKLSLFSVIRNALNTDNKDYLPYFDKAAKKSLSIKNKLWVARFIRLFQHPFLMLKKIKHKLIWKFKRS